MVLATSEAGPPRGVARWEFSPAQAQSAVADAGSHAMQFRLEIPDDAPLAGTFELWVRLIAGEEGKLLAHARLDLQQPGGFASAPFDAADAQRPEGEIIASRFDHHEPDGLGPAAVAMTGGEGQWTIARHSIANISASAAATGGRWRTATGPPPVAMAISSQRISERIPSADVKILPAPSTVQQVAHLETPEAADASNLPASREIVPPVWSPTR
jgi:hypothetical protein